MTRERFGQNIRYVISWLTVPCTGTSTVCNMSNTLQAEGLCLRFPENLPPHANLSHEVAVQMLGRAISLATQIAFQPSYIDKPPGAASPQLWRDLPILF
jgi:hypothetical protein